jgi:hypothetical protein
MIQTKHFFKILFTATFYFAISSLNANTLAIADSLFENRNYSKAFDTYQEIYRSGEYSPAMLLRMANICERQNNPALALHFLETYYQTTGDGTAVVKMREMAAAQNLIGYDFGDVEYIRSVISRYLSLIIWILLGLNFLLLALLFYRKYKLNQQPGLSVFLQLALLAILAYAVNGNTRATKGILYAKNVYLMDGPSPGAELVDIVPPGHRVEVIGTDSKWHETLWNNKQVNVWLKVIWNDEPAYVKTNQILLGKES